MTVPVNPIVEMNIDGVWVDITPDCRQGSADSGGGFEISRGVPNEGNFAEPTQFNFTLNNGVSRAAATEGQSAVYSPMNPLGPHFGKLGRNQRVRIGLDRRFDGFDRSPDVVDGWGSMPDHIHADGTTIIPGEKWYTHGLASAFSTSSGIARIAAGGAPIRFARLEKEYRDSDVVMRFQVSDRTSEVGVITRVNQAILEPPVGTSIDGGSDGWTSAGGTLAVDTTVFRGENTRSLRLTVAGTPSVGSITSALSPTTLWFAPKGANSSYRLRGWLRSSVATTVRGSVSWYASDATTFLGSTLGFDRAITPNTWLPVEMITALPPQDAYYARLVFNFPSGTNPQDGWQLWMQDPELTDTTETRLYSCGILPGATDAMVIRRTAKGSDFLQSEPLPFQIVADTYYMLRVQQAGQRTRGKIWLFGDDEPTGWHMRRFWDDYDDRVQPDRTGNVGAYAMNGGAQLRLGDFQVDQWRAHTEIAELPPRFDLSRRDHWVPIQSRGILRRLNQGRKALKSAVSLHLQEYASLSKGWWPLEDDEGTSAGNNVAGGQLGLISGLAFGQPEDSGLGALPGVSGIATLDQDSSRFTASVIPHSVIGGKETFLWFMRLPALPASETQFGTVYSAGTVQTWQFGIHTTGAIRVIGLDRNGTEIVNRLVAMWGGNPDMPVGCWLACTLYLTQDGGNVEYAFNHHRPGSSSFFSVNGVYAGTVGAHTGIQFRSNPVLTTAGNLQISQVMHYAGDLPFVTYDFSMAARAYVGELGADRVLRLGANAGVPVTTTGISTLSNPMGVQTPSKLTDLFEEAAIADDGIIAEERDDFGLTFITRMSLWNRDPLTLDIDAGHLTTPLEGNFDDQALRNDVTINRPNGSFRRAIQTSGPNNVNPPEADPINGVGTYDEQDTVNVATDDLCGSHANWRVSRGTMEDPRYPGFKAMLHGAAYQLSPALAAGALSLDLGDQVLLVNTEADYIPRYQGITGYTESIPDLYEHNLVWTAEPNRIRRAGTVNHTTRVGSESIVTQAAFTAGVGTELRVRSDTGHKFVQLGAGSDVHWPFDIDVAGVRLRVTMTGVVLNSNPGFEDGTTGWEAVGAIAFAPDRFDPKGGEWVLRAHAPGAGTYGIATSSAAGVAVVAGASYRVSGWVKTEAAATDLTIAMDWYSAGPTFISSSSLIGNTTTALTWKFVNAILTAPVGATTGRIRISNVFASNTRMWLDNLRITRMASEGGDPQSLVVEQIPVNASFGVTGKIIPVGSPVRVVDAFHVAWGVTNP